MSRASSAGRQRRSQVRRSSLSAERSHANVTVGKTAVLSGIDLRNTKQKIEDLETELKDDLQPEKHLEYLVLLQVYSQLEYGEMSMENARAYLKLAEFYFRKKIYYLYQAKLHALSALAILEQLQIRPNTDHLDQNLLGFQLYLFLARVSLSAKKYLLQRETKVKNKHLLSISLKHIGHDLQLAEKYLHALKNFLPNDDYDRHRYDYLQLKFESILLEPKEYDSSIDQIAEDLLSYINQYHSQKSQRLKIDLLIRCGSYLINLDQKTRRALTYYEQAVELAEDQERTHPSEEHRHQLAQALLQRSQAKVRANRVNHRSTEKELEATEKDFQRAIKLFEQAADPLNRHVLRVIDELATYYSKIERYQDALNILCETLPDKIRVFGDFSDEVIQTESRIGALYLREGECLNAAEHLKTCLDLQEFVYGPKDSRTCQTRQTIDILKKDPMVCHSFFARTLDRPAFRMTQRVSYEKDDLRLLQTVTKKPPSGTKTSFLSNK